VPPSTVTKEGQKPLRQEKSLLQVDWSMARLRPELGLHRHDGDAVRLHPAIAAALADIGVDEDALVDIGEGAALAAAAFLGGAGLDVDDGGDAFELLEPFLHRHQVVALVAFEVLGEGDQSISSFGS
jgi:hypothetical protein